MYLLLLLLSRFSHVQLCATHRRQPTRLARPWDTPGKNTGVGCHFLLQCMKVKSESLDVSKCLLSSLNNIHFVSPYLRPFSVLKILSPKLNSKMQSSLNSTDCKEFLSSNKIIGFLISFCSKYNKVD